MSGCRVAVLVLSLSLLGGCFNDYESENVNHVHVTLGEQLLDLQKAQDAGVIDSDEFEAAKTKLLENPVACVLEEDSEEEEEEEDDSFWF